MPRLRDTALQFCLSFPTFEQWNYKKKIRCMPHRHSLPSALLLFVIALQTVLAFPQQLTVQNETAKPVVLSRADIESLPRLNITSGSGANAASFEGVSLKAVLEKAGVPFGESLKGKRMALCLLVEAADGYRAVFALAEIDPAFTDKRFILAFLKDGKPLNNNEGPYRIVIPDEKRMARWVRQVTTLKVLDVQ
jgi:hypothetical protein